MTYIIQHPHHELASDILSCIRSQTAIYWI